ncbi:Smr/MutS family protein, partial [Escherichia coli]|uniref:Smr/MutS family protein n=1 Tax=Escherichia coli TaxID=562 RepID=UPI003EE10507
LKQQTPLWLAQHPHVMAFHQAPKEYGGDAALLVLIEVEEWLPLGCTDDNFYRVGM